ncbi:MAG: MerR family transcriptional regulator [Myxococcales bacterium]|nr:MerR family transcriptional regulator [Myxococcales bacterium]
MSRDDERGVAARSPISVVRRADVIPEKQFFKIGEVAEIAGVKPHVLRYWESEFTQLNPKKTRGSHRHYSRRDLDLVMEIKRLLHDEGYTVAGAKQRIRELRAQARKEGREPEYASAREVALRVELIAVRDKLLGLLDELDAEKRAKTPEPQARVVVEKIVHTARTPGRR